MSIVLDPSKNFVAIQIRYIEEQDEKHGNVRYHFINSRAEFDKWRTKGYLTETEMSEELSGPNPDPVQKNQPGMPLQPPKPPQDPKKIISVLKTWWSRMTWKEQNQIYSRCLRQVGAEGKTRTEMDMISYRDLKLKTCLKKWDLKDDNGQEMPITDTIVDQLVPEVANELLSNFELVTEASEEQMGE